MPVLLTEKSIYHFFTWLKTEHLISLIPNLSFSCNIIYVAGDHYSMVTLLNDNVDVNARGVFTNNYE